MFIVRSTEVIEVSGSDKREYQQILIDLDDPDLMFEDDQCFLLYWRHVLKKFYGMSKEEIKVRLTMEGKVYYQCM